MNHAPTLDLPEGLSLPPLPLPPTEVASSPPQATIKAIVAITIKIEQIFFILIIFIWLVLNATKLRIIHTICNTPNQPFPDKRE